MTVGQSWYKGGPNVNSDPKRLSKVTQLTGVGGWRLKSWTIRIVKKSGGAEVGM